MKTKSEENGIKSAFPLRWDLSPNEACVEFGLTKREIIAAMAMQGLIARTTTEEMISMGNLQTQTGVSPMDAITLGAVNFADALLAKLAESEAQNA